MTSYTCWISPIRRRFPPPHLPHGGALRLFCVAVARHWAGQINSLPTYRSLALPHEFLLA